MGTYLAVDYFELATRMVQSHPSSVSNFQTDSGETLFRRCPRVYFDRCTRQDRRFPALYCMRTTIIVADNDGIDRPVKPHYQVSYRNFSSRDFLSSNRDLCEHLHVELSFPLWYLVVTFSIVTFSVVVFSWWSYQCENAELAMRR